MTILTCRLWRARAEAVARARHGFHNVRVLSVKNEFFGGNLSVAGLMAGADIGPAL